MLSALSCLRQRLARSCRAPILLPLLEARSSPRKCFSSTSRVSKTAVSHAQVSNVSTETRQNELAKAGFCEYPRAGAAKVTSLGTVREIYAHKLQPGEVDANAEDVTVTGRIASTRAAGSKLLFLDIVKQPGNVKLQIVLDKGKLPAHDGAGNVVKGFARLIQRGDTISVTGKPYRSSAGELSLLAATMPELLSPCLHQIPTTAFGHDSDLAQDRHVEMLTDPSVIDVLTARHKITTSMTQFLSCQGFISVQTPVLAASAGGATARPFTTSATEFPNRQLALRIAPELWLKRLIVGGMDRIFEIGTSFRNEGLDKTHNPEFTTCEFYAVDWTLSQLQDQTHKMIVGIAAQLTEVDPAFHESVGRSATMPWSQIDFIPALNEVLGCELPDLSTATARQEILRIFQQKQLLVPATPTLPRLLDKLASVYLEPRCKNATWIVNIPECLSPLAKSFAHPSLPYQRVAARAELFIHSKEIVNCYEEENSPFEQRRKFVDQQRHARLTQEGEDNTQNVDEEAMKIDEDYIKCLEWGLPPTGGWGCGIDRLVMLMLGKEKISDVLAFGNLRQVTRGAEKVEKKVDE